MRRHGGSGGELFSRGSALGASTTGALRAPPPGLSHHLDRSTGARCQALAFTCSVGNSRWLWRLWGTDSTPCIAVDVLLFDLHNRGGWCAYNTILQLHKRHRLLSGKWELWLPPWSASARKSRCGATGIGWRYEASPTDQAKRAQPASLLRSGCQIC